MPSKSVPKLRLAQTCTLLFATNIYYTYNNSASSYNTITSTPLMTLPVRSSLTSRFAMHFLMAMPDKFQYGLVELRAPQSDYRIRAWPIGKITLVPLLLLSCGYTNQGKGLTSKNYRDLKLRFQSVHFVSSHRSRYQSSKLNGPERCSLCYCVQSNQVRRRKDVGGRELTF